MVQELDPDTALIRGRDTLIGDFEGAPSGAQYESRLSQIRYRPFNTTANYVLATLQRFGPLIFCKAKLG